MDNIKENNVDIDCQILKFIALNSKLQRSDLRIYFFMLSLQRPVYQKELIELACNDWDNFKDWINIEDKNLKFVSDFRAEVICRCVKNLLEFNLIKVTKQEGNNKFLIPEKDFNIIKAHNNKLTEI